MQTHGIWEEKKKKLPTAIKITGKAAACHSFQTIESVLTHQKGWRHDKLIMKYKAIVTNIYILQKHSPYSKVCTTEKAVLPLSILNGNILKCKERVNSN